MSILLHIKHSADEKCLHNKPDKQNSTPGTQGGKKELTTQSYPLATNEQWMSCGMWHPNPHTTQIIYTVVIKLRCLK